MSRAAEQPQVHLLFSSGMTTERWSWLVNVFNKTSPSLLRLHLTGESLYQLISDPDPTFPPEMIHWDEYEAKIIGIAHQVNETYPLQKKFGDITPHSFWTQLLAEITALNPSVKSFDLFHNSSPYMHRDAVHAVRYLETAFRNNLQGNLLCYLDGIHLGNSFQNPSEFQNIGTSLQSISQEHQEFTMLACARCAKARGYVSREENGDIYVSDKMIPRFSIVNLRHIVQRFLEGNIVLSLNGGVVLPRHYHEIPPPVPSILIFITHSPYDTEWAFGALSLAIAANNQNIPVQVVFIEQGVYALNAPHQIPAGDNLFNIQEIIHSVDDEIPFYYYSPSCSTRKIDTIHTDANLCEIEPPHLYDLMLKGPNDPNIRHRRIFFF